MYLSQVQVTYIIVHAFIVTLGNATTDCVPLIENEGSAHMSADAENVQTEMEISSKKKRKQKDKVVRF